MTLILIAPRTRKIATVALKQVRKWWQFFAVAHA